jgi:hypothetical protein
VDCQTARWRKTPRIRLVGLRCYEFGVGTSRKSRINAVFLSDPENNSPSCRLNGGGCSLLRTRLCRKFPLTGKNAGNSSTLCTNIGIAKRLSPTLHGANLRKGLGLGRNETGNYQGVTGTNSSWNRDFAECSLFQTLAKSEWMRRKWFMKIL